MSDAHRRRVQQQFGPSAAAYVASPGHAAGDDLDRLVAWGRPLSPRTVLDLATGGGHTAIAFAAFSSRVVALDLTEAMLRAARGLARTKDVGAVVFVAGDVEALPFRDAAFEVVTCRTAAHHFANVGGAVREVARLLRRGGTVLLQDIVGHDDPACAQFILEVERRRDPSYVRSYRAAEWQALLKSAGLTVLDDTLVPKVRPWEEWTGRMRMRAQDRRDLDRFVLDAPERCRAAFQFEVAGDRIESFTDRMFLVRAEKS